MATAPSLTLDKCVLHVGRAVRLGWRARRLAPEHPLWAALAGLVAEPAWDATTFSVACTLLQLTVVAPPWLGIAAVDRLAALAKPGDLVPTELAAELSVHVLAPRVAWAVVALLGPYWPAAPPTPPPPQLSL
jgi:hypothetical protein